MLRQRWLTPRSRARSLPCTAERSSGDPTGRTPTAKTPMFLTEWLSWVGTDASHVFDVAGGDVFGWVGVAGDVPL